MDFIINNTFTITHFWVFDKPTMEAKIQKWFILKGNPRLIVMKIDNLPRVSGFDKLTQILIRKYSPNLYHLYQHPTQSHLLWPYPDLPHKLCSSYPEKYYVSKPT